jgi:predicted HNH restriction endonuclease
MGKRLPTTPRSRVTAALRSVWLRSRERSAAIKRESGCCEVCGKKQSAAKGREVKLEVHHLNGIQWQQIIDRIYKEILCDPKHLMVLCKDCHQKVHEEGEI